MTYSPVGFAGQRFVKTFYFAYLGAGDGSSAQAPLSMAADNATVMDIPAGTLIDKVYCIIDTAVTGTTNFDIGDDDDADGYLDSSLSVTLGTPGLYGWDAKLAGAYLRVQTAGATDAGDIYVVPAAKFYSATGKEIKMDLTTAATAGALRVVVEGVYFGR